VRRSDGKAAVPGVGGSATPPDAFAIFLPGTLFMAFR